MLKKTFGTFDIGVFLVFDVLNTKILVINTLKC